MRPPVPAVVERRTSETTVRVEVVAGSGVAHAQTSVPFLDHMLSVLARYSGFDIEVTAGGDLRHHVIEDVAIALGTAFSRVVPSTAARFGDRTVPMDDALVQAVLDTGGRPYYRGPLPSSLYDHFLRSFCDAARFTLHVVVIRGTDRHHVVEASFKAFGLALRQASEDALRVFSTKGDVTLEVQ